MTDDVKRYSSAAVAIATGGSPLLPTEDGPWVKYSDYAALQARVAELEAERDAIAQQFDKEDDRPALMARIIIRSINNEVRAEAAEALLSEAVKAGMLRAIGIAYIACAETPDETSVDAVADAIETAASDPETIARIVASLKEGRG
jgi:hypothetical protein